MLNQITTNYQTLTTSGTVSIIPAQQCRFAAGKMMRLMCKMLCALALGMGT